MCSSLCLDHLNIKKMSWLLKRSSSLTNDVSRWALQRQNKNSLYWLLYFLILVVSGQYYMLDTLFLHFKAKYENICTFEDTKICGLLTKWKVRMGWLLTKLLFFASLWTKLFLFASLWTRTRSRPINSQRKKEPNIQPSWWDKLGQLKRFSIDFDEPALAYWETFLAGHNAWSRARTMRISVPLR